MKKIFAIIVNYKQKQKTLALRKKLTKQEKNLKLTTIVIDNSDKNIGFAAAVNKGLRVALYKKADFVLLLNPDVKIPAGLVSNLVKIRADITGPVIKFKKNGQWIHDLGGKVDWKWGRTRHVEMQNHAIRHSGDPPVGGDSRIVKNRFWTSQNDVIEKSNQPDYLSGCCLLIKRKVLEKVGLFDERFFLYFEDVDFQVRAKKAGFKIAIDKSIVITHFLKGQDNNPKPFSNLYHNLLSNLFFIRKHQKGFNLITSLAYWLALVFKVFLNQGFQKIKKHLVFITIFSLALFLRTLAISQTLIFTHEIGRDYLAAKAIIFDHNLALIGPPSSHPWLYHGPFFYYLLALFLGIFHFNPYAGYFLVLIGGLVNILAIYYFSSRLLSKETGIFSALLAAVFPWMVELDRLPAHYSLVPLFSLLSFGFFLFYVKKYLGKNLVWIIIAGFLAGFSMQLHLSSFILVVFTILILLSKQRAFFWYIFSFVLTLIPLIIYDSSQNFRMISSFLLWLPYRVINQASSHNFIWLLLFLGIVLLLLLKKNLKILHLFILFIALGISLLLAHGDPPFHYFYFLFPAIFILSGLVMAKINRINPWGKMLTGVIVVVVLGFSLYRFFFLDLPPRLVPKAYPPTLSEQRKTISVILQDAKGQEFALSRYGFLDQFDGYLDNYKYLTWWMGGKVNKNSSLAYLIFEDKKKLADFLTSNYNKISSVFDLGQIVIIRKEGKL
ncbi:glycosyltransferase family 39 protein [Candidatus Gottesmanbacteria bacterium]|nr:glycosyltransferase family 39 protein [Candidatus Gottesmanbacteria bacterium]